MDWRDLIAGVGGLNPQGGSGFLRGFQRAKQEIAEREAREAQAGQRQEDLTLRKNADARAANQDTRATQAQTVTSMNALRQLLQDESLDTPDAFQERMNFAMQLAPQLGVEQGFLQKTFTPAPDTFTKRRLRKVYDKFEKLSQGEREAFEAGGSWDIDGTKYTPATVRQALGFGGTNIQTGEPFAFTPKPPAPEKPPTPATPGSFEEYVGLSPEQQRQREQQRQKWGRADDSAPRVTVNTGDRRRDTRTDAKAKSFDALPIVKTTQKMAEAASFANSLNPNTKNPADDQALIYAFAKAMDPDSVVREGEYATVQKYAQSWAESFGFNAARIFSNTPFLTPQSRQNMKKTIMSRFGAARGQYDNVRKSYASQIDRITGGVDGDEYLTDYAGGFPSTEPPARSGATYDDYKRAKGKK